MWLLTPALSHCIILCPATSNSWTWACAVVWFLSKLCPAQGIPATRSVLFFMPTSISSNLAFVVSPTQCTHPIHHGPLRLTTPCIRLSIFTLVPYPPLTLPIVDQISCLDWSG